MYPNQEANSASIYAFAQAVQNVSPVSGHTHNFYKYPARFSPWFARSAISAFTNPGDWMLDPFMGGGTTIVEALASGRRVVGFDLNELSLFIARAKTTLLSAEEAALVSEVALTAAEAAVLRSGQLSRLTSHESTAQNLSGSLWRVGATIAMIKRTIGKCSNERVRRICTAALLLSSQRKLDCRLDLPKVSEIRTGFLVAVEELVESALAYRDEVTKAWSYRPSRRISQPILYQASCSDDSAVKAIRFPMRPRLILTSPPYPGVHVLYHRWQILGRRETDAPYWITDCKDGSGGAYYTFGDRKSKSLDSYFNGITSSFSTLRQICRSDTLVVQLMAFADIDRQLPRYLLSMKEAGYVEVRPKQLANSEDGRLWRSIPNRKWYSCRSDLDSSTEVVLIHCPMSAYSDSPT